MGKIYHGSKILIMYPDPSFKNEKNDYGCGFYCTDSMDMSKEWATKDGRDGIMNCYSYDMSDMKILYLSDGEYTVLNWIAILLKHRIFNLNSSFAISAREYLLQNFYLNVNDYDVIIGYRADDSYFSYAQAFVENRIPVRSLEKAMQLGKLGIQIVLKSEKAFNGIKFESSEFIDKDIYFPKYKVRDELARRTYQEEIKNSSYYKEDIFILDILREEIKNDDPRIQRIILK